MEQQTQQGGFPSANCEQVRQFALEFLDGELDEPLMVAFRIHIEVCQPCGRRITFEAAFLKMITRAARAGQMPDSVEERCQSILREWKSRES
jgi:anti-sigma factor (TIGR02949 family)